MRFSRRFTSASPGPRARSLRPFSAFREIYVATPAEVCETRDPKGHYAKARSGGLPSFTGITNDYQPPTGNVKVETIQGPPPPSNPNAVKELAAKEAELKKRQMDSTEAAKKAEAQRAQLAKVGDACTRAQMQIRQLAAEMIGLARYNEKGEIVIVDDATRRKEREQPETWYRANCGT